MPSLRDLYGNSAKTGFTIDFFSLTAPGAQNALLASPFFSTYEPIRLLSERGCQIKLLVRLCSITTPNVLREALGDINVAIRYFTAQSFHSKFYIVDNVALVGSANLTAAGLKTNREVSVLLRADADSAFDELPGLFDLLWDYADVLTVGVLDQFEKAFRAPDRPKDDGDFDNFLAAYVAPCLPPTVRVHSDKVTKRRSFLQTFRRKYDERLVPAFKEVAEVFKKDGRRRKEFSDADLKIEISRFLGWLRIVHAPAETWMQSPLMAKDQRATRIQNYIEEWHRTSDITNGDMINAVREKDNIALIRKNFADAEVLRGLTYDDLFDTLTGCHAFMELLRFTEGGLPGLRIEFARLNSLKQIQDMLAYLAFGNGEILERAYDCIYDEAWKLHRFGEACIMELVGWLGSDRVPINGRTIKALRFLGFDVI